MEGARQKAGQRAAYEAFRELHEDGRLFVMPNAWDAASARVFVARGFRALGSSSAALAMMRGVQDGTRGVSRAAAIAHAADLARFSGLPVNGDLEDGFGSEPEQVRATVEAAIAGGLAGLGIEDTTADPEQPIHGFDHAVRRVRAAVQAARGQIVLTARADGLLHGSDDLDEIIRRLVAFAEVGADVLYAPGLRELEDVRRIVEAVAPSPVNVLLPPAFSAATIPELERCGVRRTSIGGAGFWSALRAVDRAALCRVIVCSSELWAHCRAAGSTYGRVEPVQVMGSTSGIEDCESRETLIYSSPCSPLCVR